MSVFTPIVSAWSSVVQFYRRCKASKAGKVLLNKYFIATLVFLVIVGFVDTNNVGEYIRTNRRLKEQRQQIDSYKESIRTTENKLMSLQSQRDSLERFAREEYYYSEDGEDVYVMDE